VWFRLPALLALLAFASCTHVCDVHIAGGVVVDGTGAPARRADVLIADGRIIEVGLPGAVRAARTIDATGLIVTPGFIDPHAHGDPRRTPGFANFVAMGVTTICLGQDGVSPGDRDFGEWLTAIAKGTPGCNIAPLVGHGTLRRLAGLEMGPAPTPEQLGELQRLIATAMAAGAHGISLGLEYEPGRFANPAELEAVFAALAPWDGVAMAHVRSEDDDAIDAALREFVGACPPGGRAHVAHLKVVYGKGLARADRLLELLAELRTGGRTVTADVYPYVASYTGIGIVFPDWARPPHSYPQVVAARRDELAAFLRQRVARRNGPQALLFGSGDHAGRTLAEVAADARAPFEEVLIQMGPDGAGAAHFVMEREVMERLLVAEHVVVSSDGSPTMRHPRGHGAFARVIREFVGARPLLGIERAVHKMTGRTAEIVGLPDRGRIAPGLAADVLVFDPAKVVDRATFERPFDRAEGFDTVLIGGVLVRSGGVATDARPGRLLLRRRP